MDRMTKTPQTQNSKEEKLKKEKGNLKEAFADYGEDILLEGQKYYQEDEDIFSTLCQVLFQKEIPRLLIRKEFPKKGVLIQLAQGSKLLQYSSKKNKFK